MTAEEEKNNIIKTNIAHRKSEVLAYDINIEQYKHQLVALDALDALDDDEVNDAIFKEHRERLTKLIKTETIERTKAYLALKALEASLPPEEPATE